MAGGWEFDDFSEIEVLLTPCNYIHQEYGPMVSPSGVVGDTVSAECIADLEAQKEYLGPLEVLILSNNETLNLLGYDDEMFEREAKLAQFQTDQKNPSFVMYYMDASVIYDETTSFLKNLGYEEVTHFYSAPTEIISVASAWDKFPVNDPQNPELAFTKYKFISFSVGINMD